MHLSALPFKKCSHFEMPNQNLCQETTLKKMFSTRLRTAIKESLKTVLSDSTSDAINDGWKMPRLSGGKRNTHIHTKGRHRRSRQKVGCVEVRPGRVSPLREPHSPWRPPGRSASGRRGEWSRCGAVRWAGLDWAGQG